MKFKSILLFSLGALTGASVVTGVFQRSETMFSKGHPAPGHEPGMQKPAVSPETDAPHDQIAGTPRENEIKGEALSPAQVLARLAGLKTLSGGSLKDRRRLIGELEALRKMGPAALPAIREFLAGGDDVDFDANAARAFRNGKVPLEFLVPPSLRLGLLEVVKDIGGEAGQQLLGQELGRAGRGIEVAYLAGALQQMAGDTYREEAARAARDLLAMPALPAGAPGGLDTHDRDFLYGTLATLKDTSYVAQAEAEVLRTDGQLDRASLRYLQSALGEKSIGLARKLWADPRLADEKKGPVAQLALSYVGVNPEAEKLFFTAIDGSRLNGDTRRNLIEDLNQTGFPNAKNLTAADLPMIEKRLALIESSLPGATDTINIAAFKEARKDLLAMRAKLTN